MPHFQDYLAQAYVNNDAEFDAAMQRLAAERNKLGALHNSNRGALHDGGSHWTRTELEDYANA